MSVIRVDSRVGSKHLFDPLKKLLVGSPHTVSLTTLKFGDVAWSATDAEGIPFDVGVELVKIPDLLAKIESRRLIDHQLPGLIGHYKVVYLVVEGRWLAKEDGFIDIHAGAVGRHGWTKKEWRDSGWKYAAVNGFLTSLQCFPGVIVVRTMDYPQDMNETIHWIKSTASWWSQPWSEHSSFNAWAGVTVLGNPLSLRKPSKVEKVAAIMPGIGQDKCRLVAEKFGTIRKLVNAKAEDWVGIRPPGKTPTGKVKNSITLNGALEVQQALDEEHR